MKKNKQYLLIELACAVIILALLAERMLPKFLEAQRNINTAYHIPDENFRKVMAEYMGVSENGYYTKEEAIEWSVSNKILTVDQKNISSLKGVEYFKHIYELHCSNNNLTKLDISSLNELTELYAQDNQIEEIFFPFSTKLTILNLANNQLLKLDISKFNQLTFFTCSNNLIQTIDVSNVKSLKLFGADGNRLKFIDTTKNNNLQLLNINDNQISELDISSNKMLYYVNISDNPIQKLILPPHPKYYYLYMENVKMRLSELNIDQLSNINLINYCGNPIDQRELEFLMKLEDIIGTVDRSKQIKPTGLTYSATMIIDATNHQN